MPRGVRSGGFVNLSRFLHERSGTLVVPLICAAIVARSAGKIRAVRVAVSAYQKWAFTGINPQIYLYKSSTLAAIVARSAVSIRAVLVAESKGV